MHRPHAESQRELLRAKNYPVGVFCSQFVILKLLTSPSQVTTKLLAHRTPALRKGLGECECCPPPPCRLQRCARASPYSTGCWVWSRLCAHLPYRVGTASVVTTSSTRASQATSPLKAQQRARDVCQHLFCTSLLFQLAKLLPQ